VQINSAFQPHFRKLLLLTMKSKFCMTILKKKENHGFDFDQSSISIAKSNIKKFCKKMVCKDELTCTSNICHC